VEDDSYGGGDYSSLFMIGDISRIEGTWGKLILMRAQYAAYALASIVQTQEPPHWYTWSITGATITGIVAIIVFLGRSSVNLWLQMRATRQNRNALRLAFANEMQAIRSLKASPVRIPYPPICGCSR
jgi:hypothetical protein